MQEIILITFVDESDVRIWMMSVSILRRWDITFQQADQAK